MTTGRNCSVCGMDISQRKRTRDAQGRYYCEQCAARDERSSSHARRPTRKDPALAALMAMSEPEEEEGEEEEASLEEVAASQRNPAIRVRDQYEGPTDYYTPARYRAPTHTNGMAIASFICALVLCGILGGILGITFGLTAKNQIAQSHGREGGEGFATAGIVLGILGLVGSVIWFVIVVGVAMSHS